jgi:hypothetical protein
MQHETGELKQAVKRAKMKSAKGPDDVSNRIIKLASEDDQFESMMLQAINNEILRSVTYPTSLKLRKLFRYQNKMPGNTDPLVCCLA